MTNINDGGPAFPQNDLSNYNMGPDGIGNGIGMSLRDWFAGQALAGVAIDPEAREHDWSAQAYANWSYALADAMLAARAAKATPDAQNVLQIVQQNEVE